jgi:uncharacterized RDD family membrane protein YckC
MGDYQPFRPPVAPLADGGPEEQELAGRGLRLAAKLLDGLCVAGVAIFLGILAAISMPILLRSDPIGHASPAAVPVAATLVTLAFLCMVALIVWNCVWLRRYGQTVGKRAVGIRIVRSDGSRASLGRIFALRYLPMALLSAIPFLGFFIRLTDILLIFRDSRQCLHDQIADTKVVRAG